MGRGVTCVFQGGEIDMGRWGYRELELEGQMRRRRECGEGKRERERAGLFIKDFWISFRLFVQWQKLPPLKIKHASTGHWTVPRSNCSNRAWL